MDVLNYTSPEENGRRFGRDVGIALMDLYGQSSGNYAVDVSSFSSDPDVVNARGEKVMERLMAGNKPVSLVVDSSDSAWATRVLDRRMSPAWARKAMSAHPDRLKVYTGAKVAWDAKTIPSGKLRGAKVSLNADLGGIQHTKIYYSQDAGRANGRAVPKLVVSTANLTNNAYYRQLNIFYETTDAGMVQEGKRVSDWVHGRAAKPTGLKHFVVGGPEGGKAVSQASRVAEFILEGKGDVTIASATLSDGRVIAALKEAAKDGRKITVGVNADDQWTSADERLSGLKNITVLKSSKEQGHATFSHANIIRVGNDVLFGTMRASKNAMKGAQAEILMKVRGDKKFAKFTDDAVKAWFDQSAARIYQTPFQDVLDWVAPMKHVATARYLIDPSIGAQAKLYAVQAGVDLRKRPGLGASLYVSLMEEQGLPYDEIPGFVKAFDRAAVTPTWGMDTESFWSPWRYVGAQIGERGPIDTALYRVGRWWDSQTHPNRVGEKPETPVTDRLLFGWDLTSNLVSNVGTFYFFNKPVLRAVGDVMDMVNRGLKTVSHSTGPMGFAADKVLAMDQAAKRATGAIILETMLPSAKLVGMGDAVRNAAGRFLAFNENSYAQVHAQSFDELDKGSVHVFKLLGSQGVGAFFEHFNINHVLRQGREIFLGTQALLQRDITRAASHFDLVRHHARATYEAYLGTNVTDKNLIAGTQPGMRLGRHLMALGVGAVFANRVYADLAAAERSSVITQWRFEHGMNALIKDEGARAQLAVYKKPGLPDIPWLGPLAPLAAVPIFYGEKLLAIPMNSFREWDTLRKRSEASGMRDILASEGLHGMGALLNAARFMDLANQGRFTGSGDTLKGLGLAAISQAGMGHPEAASKLLAAAQLSALSPHVFSSTARNSWSMAFQVSPIQQVMALTLATTRLGNTQTFNLSIQGPVALPFGLNLGLPIALTYDRVATGPGSDEVKEVANWAYSPGSTMEAAVKMAILGNTLGYLDDLGKKLGWADDNVLRMTGWAARGIGTTPLRLFNQAFAVGPYNLLRRNQQNRQMLRSLHSMGLIDTHELYFFRDDKLRELVQADFVDHRVSKLQDLVNTRTSGKAALSIAGQHFANLQELVFTLENSVSLKDAEKAALRQMAGIGETDVSTTSRTLSVSREHKQVDDLVKLARSATTQIYTHTAEDLLRDQPSHRDTLHQSRSYQARHRFVRGAGYAGAALFLGDLALGAVGMVDETFARDMYKGVATTFHGAGNLIETPFRALKQFFEPTPTKPLLGPVGWALGNLSGMAGAVLAAPFKFVAAALDVRYPDSPVARNLNERVAAEFGLHVGDRRSRATLSARIGSWFSNLQALKDIGYATRGNAFVNLTPLTGITWAGMPDHTFAWSKSYAQVPFKGLTVTYATGLSGTKVDAQLDQLIAFSNFMAIADPVSFVSSLPSVDRKPAVAGKMWHRDSGRWMAGHTTAMALRVRDAQFAWALQTNDKRYMARYFFINPHLKGATQAGAFFDLRTMPRGIMWMGGTFKKNQDGEIIADQGRLTKMVQNALTHGLTAEAYEIDPGNIYDNVGAGLSKPVGLNTELQHARDYLTNPVMLIAGLASTVAAGGIGYRLVKKALEIQSRGVHTVAQSLQAKYIKAGHGIQNAYLHRVEPVVGGGYQIAPPGVNGKPSYQYLLIGVGDRLYTYGDMDTPHLGTPFWTSVKKHQRVPKGFSMQRIHDVLLAAQDVVGAASSSGLDTGKGVKGLLAAMDGSGNPEGFHSLSSIISKQMTSLEVKLANLERAARTAETNLQKAIDDAVAKGETPSDQMLKRRDTYRETQAGVQRMRAYYAKTHRARVEIDRIFKSLQPKLEAIRAAGGGYDVQHPKIAELLEEKGTSGVTLGDELRVHLGDVDKVVSNLASTDQATRMDGELHAQTALERMAMRQVTGEVHTVFGKDLMGLSRNQAASYRMHAFFDTPFMRRLFGTNLMGTEWLDEVKLRQSSLELKRQLSGDYVEALGLTDDVKATALQDALEATLHDNMLHGNAAFSTAEVKALLEQGLVPGVDHRGLADATVKELTDKLNASRERGLARRHLIAGGARAFGFGVVSLAGRALTPLSVPYQIAGFGRPFAAWYSLGVASNTTYSESFRRAAYQDWEYHKYEQALFVDRAAAFYGGWALGKSLLPVGQALVSEGTAAAGAAWHTWRLGAQAKAGAVASRTLTRAGWTATGTALRTAWGKVATMGLGAAALKAVPHLKKFFQAKRIVQGGIGMFTAPTLVGGVAMGAAIAVDSLILGKLQAWERAQADKHRKWEGELPGGVTGLAAQTIGWGLWGLQSSFEHLLYWGNQSARKKDPLSKFWGGVLQTMGGIGVGLLRDTGAYRFYTPELEGSSASLHNAMLSRSPLWHGNITDLLNRTILEQDAAMLGKPDEVLSRWLDSSLYGQRDLYGTMMGDAPRGTQALRELGPRAIIKSEALSLALGVRALSTQHVLYRLRRRSMLKNEHVFQAEQETRSSGYMPGRNVSSLVNIQTATFRTPSALAYELSDRTGVARAETIGRGMGHALLGLGAGLMAPLLLFPATRIFGGAGLAGLAWASMQLDASAEEKSQTPGVAIREGTYRVDPSTPVFTESQRDLPGMSLGTVGMLTAAGGAIHMAQRAQAPQRPWVAELLKGVAHRAKVTVNAWVASLRAGVSMSWEATKSTTRQVAAMPAQAIQALRTFSLADFANTIYDKALQFRGQVVTAFRNLKQLPGQVWAAARSLGQIPGQLWSKAMQLVPQAKMLLTKIPEAFAKFSGVFPRTAAFMGKAANWVAKGPEAVLRASQQVSAFWVARAPGLLVGVREAFAKLPQLATKLPELWSRVPQLVSRIPEALSKLPGLFSWVPTGLDKLRAMGPRSLDHLRGITNQTVQAGRAVFAQLRSISLTWPDMKAMAASAGTALRSVLPWATAQAYAGKTALNMGLAHWMSRLYTGVASAEAFLSGVSRQTVVLQTGQQATQAARIAHAVRVAKGVRAVPSPAPAAGFRSALLSMRGMAGNLRAMLPGMVGLGGMFAMGMAGLATVPLATIGLVAAGVAAVGLLGWAGYTAWKNRKPGQVPARSVGAGVAALPVDTMGAATFMAFQALKDFNLGEFLMPSAQAATLHPSTRPQPQSPYESFRLAKNALIHEVYYGAVHPAMRWAAYDLKLQAPALPKFNMPGLTVPALSVPGIRTPEVRIPALRFDGIRSQRARKAEKPSVATAWLGAQGHRWTLARRELDARVSPFVASGQMALAEGAAWAAAQGRLGVAWAASQAAVLAGQAASGLKTSWQDRPEFVREWTSASLLEMEDRGAPIYVRAYFDFQNPIRHLVRKSITESQLRGDELDVLRDIATLGHKDGAATVAYDGSSPGMTSTMAAFLGRFSSDRVKIGGKDAFVIRDKYDYNILANTPRGHRAVLAAKQFLGIPQPEGVADGKGAAISVFGGDSWVAELSWHWNRLWAPTFQVHENFAAMWLSRGIDQALTLPENPTTGAFRWMRDRVKPTRHYEGQLQVPKQALFSLYRYWPEAFAAYGKDHTNVMDVRIVIPAKRGEQLDPRALRDYHAKRREELSKNPKLLESDTNAWYAGQPYTFKNWFADERIVHRRFYYVLDAKGNPVKDSDGNFKINTSQAKAAFAAWGQKRDAEARALRLAAREASASLTASASLAASGSVEPGPWWNPFAPRASASATASFSTTQVLKRDTWHAPLVYPRAKAEATRSVPVTTPATRSATPEVFGPPEPAKKNVFQSFWERISGLFNKPAQTPAMPVGAGMAVPLDFLASLLLGAPAHAAELQEDAWLAHVHGRQKAAMSPFTQRPERPWWDRPLGWVKGLWKNVQERVSEGLQAGRNVLSRITGQTDRQLSYMLGQQLQVTSGYGLRKHPIHGVVKMHEGFDFKTADGKFYSPMEGKVVFAGAKNGFGKKTVIVQYGDVRFLVGHNADMHVKAGDVVKRGQLLATMGSDGASTRPHFHGELRDTSGKLLDPETGMLRMGLTPAPTLLETVSKSLTRPQRKAFLSRIQAGAIETEQRYGVPAEITMAQAALESNWGKSAIGGTNLFGIKGKGSAGSRNLPTWEVVNGRRVETRAGFAVYESLDEAMIAHGKLFQKKVYQKAVEQYAEDRDAEAFARNITGVYATDPAYAQKLIRIMRDYREEMTARPKPVKTSAMVKLGHAVANYLVPPAQAAENPFGGLPRSQVASKAVDATAVKTAARLAVQVFDDFAPTPAAGKSVAPQVKEKVVKVKEVSVVVAKKTPEESRVSQDNAQRNVSNAGVSLVPQTSVSAQYPDGSQWRSLWDNHAGVGSSVEEALFRR